MKCGAKCFLVEMEETNDVRQEYVTARTPAAARRLIRSAFGKNVTILTVREEKRQTIMKGRKAPAIPMRDE